MGRCTQELQRDEPTGEEKDGGDRGEEKAVGGG